MQNQICARQGKRDKTAKQLRSPKRKYFLPGEASMLFEAAVLQMPKSLNVIVVVSIGLVLVGCAEQSVVRKPLAAVEAANSHLGRMNNVRTTAYTNKEKGGRKNALGTYLSGRHVMSAASDWSRFPLGTRFRICSTREEFIIDDYGTALVGTNTIDLYKPTKLEMKRWGARNVDIDILQWGSEEKSLEILVPRQTCAGPKNDSRSPEEKSRSRGAGCVELESVLGENRKLEAGFGEEFLKPHFGLINGAGRRFSRE
jgi:3D (Asp-Asp-Asp) domain-containing protein